MCRHQLSELKVVHDKEQAGARSLSVGELALGLLVLPLRYIPTCLKTRGSSHQLTWRDPGRPLAVLVYIYIIYIYMCICICSEGKPSGFENPTTRVTLKKKTAPQQECQCMSAAVASRPHRLRQKSSTKLDLLRVSRTPH